MKVKLGYLGMPLLPDEMKHNHDRKLTDEQVEEGKAMLRAGNSERYVASYLGVSRHTMKVWCKPGYKEWFYENYKRFWRQDPKKKTASTKRLYHLKKGLFPEEFRGYLKRFYQKVKKPRQLEDCRKWRAKHPDYSRDYARNYYREHYSVAARKRLEGCA